MNALLFKANQRLIKYESFLGFCILLMVTLTIQENLPVKMDRKRLEQALSEYETTMHISLPRSKNNNEFKGFGFIEFQKVEEAEKALQVVKFSWY